MQLLIDFMVTLVILAPMVGLLAWLMTSDSDESDRPVAFKVKLEVSEGKCDDGSPTGSIHPSRVGRRARRRKAGQGEVSHYTKMHSRTRYRI